MMGGFALINRSDVIRIKIPFPDISSDLAVTSHMYICHCIVGNTLGFVKCQTLKPYMLIATPIKHYWDEMPDITRNPFLRATRIDCDKDFITHDVRYDDRLKTTVRPNVCEDVMRCVDYELICDGYISNHIAKDDLIFLNDLISHI